MMKSTNQQLASLKMFEATVVFWVEHSPWHLISSRPFDPQAADQQQGELCSLVKNKKGTCC